MRTVQPQNLTYRLNSRIEMLKKNTQLMHRNVKKKRQIQVWLIAIVYIWSNLNLIFIPIDTVMYVVNSF